MIIDKKKMSPGMQQYLNVKEKYQDCILLNRMGDFYEMFFEDAIIASKELDLILTGKNCGLDEKAPMCGVPYHAVQTYIAKLVANGHKVAICEQLTQPQPGKNVMLERDVVRVVTPGTIIEEEMLEGQKNNYLLSVYKHNEKLGVSYVDVSTGEFFVTTFGKKNQENEISDLVARISPSEVIGNEGSLQFYNSLQIMKISGVKKLNKYYDWAYSKKNAQERLTEQFGENYDSVYDLGDKEEIVCSAGALLEYLKETQKKSLSNINKVNFVRNSNYMTIDINTRRNLEIVESNKERKKYGSILWVLDKTKTSMGARALRRMVDEPLQNSKSINERLDGVEELVKKIIIRDRLGEILNNVYDIERLASKVAYGNVNPKDMLTLGFSLKCVPLLKKELESVQSKLLVDIRERLLDVEDVSSLIEGAIDKDAGAAMKSGGYIREVFNRELDEYRSARKDGHTWIKELEKKEAEETGIKNLKISYNKIFGYFIEVNRNQIDKVPIRYIRKQTVANNERYITEDLKVLEDKVLGSEEKALELENDIFSQLKKILLKYISSFQQIASAISTLDAVVSLAVVAVKNNYCKPNISSGIKELKIIDGRHPVVEQFIQKGQFVENDAFLDENENRIMIITGPNMAGKSTYMRQIAIITLLAHIGSFVPAREASIPITDRIFTRVGASDDLAFGQSTFMVEMSEVAHILANATNKSLVVLDEIGRGTSTFDGLSIAWSVVEHLADKYKAKTLFATHYHELTELEGVIDGVKNYKIAVKEIDDKIVFLRKIVRGGANKSFGIEVARLAGLPNEVLDRAKEISENLEAVNEKLDMNIFKERAKQAENNTKLALSIVSIIKDVDMNRVSPMHAFEILSDLVKRVREE